MIDNEITGIHEHLWGYVVSTIEDDKSVKYVCVKLKHVVGALILTALLFCVSGFVLAWLQQPGPHGFPL